MNACDRDGFAPFGMRQQRYGKVLEKCTAATRKEPDGRGPASNWSELAGQGYLEKSSPNWTPQEWSRWALPRPLVRAGLKRVRVPTL